MALSGVQLALGLVAPLGACDAWLLHRPGVRLQYGTQVWAGRLEQLPQLSAQQVAASGVTRVSCAACGCVKRGSCLTSK
jgi:hypothetical protein